MNDQILERRITEALAHKAASIPPVDGIVRAADHGQRSGWSSSRARIGAATIALVAGAAVVALVIASGGGTESDRRIITASERQSARQAQLLPLEDTYPANLIEEKQRMIDQLSPEGPIMLRETDDGPLLHSTKADTVRTLVAHSARAQGLAYNESDLLTPVRNEREELVGYTAVNLGRMLSIEEVNDPTFELCAVQVEWIARGDAERERAGLAVPSGTPRERAGC